MDARVRKRAVPDRLGSAAAIPAARRPIGHVLRAGIDGHRRHDDRTPRPRHQNHSGVPTVALVGDRTGVCQPAGGVHEGLPRIAAILVRQHGDRHRAVAVANAAGGRFRTVRRTHLGEDSRLGIVPAERIRQTVPGVLLRFVSVRPSRPACRRRKEDSRHPTATHQGYGTDHRGVDRLHGRSGPAA